MHPDATAMFLDDSLDGIQTKPRSLPYALGCKERLKNPRLHFRRNPWAVVGNFDDHAIILTVSPHAQLPAASHRVNGIVDNIRPDLTQLAAKGIHKQRDFLIIALNRHSLFQLMVKDRQRVSIVFTISTFCTGDWSMNVY